MHPNEFYNYSLNQFGSSEKEATMLTQEADRIFIVVQNV